MKLLNSGFRLSIGVASILLMTACGGGSGGPGGATGAAGSGSTGAAGTTGAVGSTGPGGGLLGGNLAGISLTSGGGLHLSAEALNRLGLSVNALTSADLVDLNLTGPVRAGVEVLRSNGQLIGVQLPGGGSFALPGAGPTTLPGGVTLPALPAGSLTSGLTGGLKGTLNNVVGGLRH